VLCLLHALFLIGLTTYSSDRSVDWSSVVGEGSVSDVRVVYFMYYGPAFFTLAIGYLAFTQGSKCLSITFLAFASANLVARMVALILTAEESNKASMGTTSLVLYSVDIVLTALEVVLAVFLVKDWGGRSRTAVAPVPVADTQLEKQVAETAPEAPKCNEESQNCDSNESGGKSEEVRAPDST